MNITKICLIIPSLTNGGSERVMSELANKWASDLNLEIYLILLTNQEQFYKTDVRVNLITPNKNYKNNIISKTLYKIWIFYYIRKSCKKINPFVILSFCETYNNIVLLSLLFIKYRLFVSDRNSPYWNIGKIHHKLRNILYKNATGIIAQTQTALEVLVKNTKNKNIKVIPNPLRKIQIIDKQVNLNARKIILNVGRNVFQKNQLELIDIFSQCDYKDWDLKIVGNGPLKEQLINKVKMLNLEDNVQILDFSKSIDEFYSESKIFAFTSIFEGFPNALNEAMAHGLACISYDCPTGPKDIIEQGVNGFLVPLNDKKKFIEMMSILMKNEEIRNKFSENAKTVNQLYSLDKIANNYYQFITSK